MCGINGIYNYRAFGGIDRRELRSTRDFMRARGPDGYGEWVSAEGAVGFGHRRLSFIDLSDNAAQPMRSDDGKVVLTFNGEIYNYRELRASLEARGCRFRSQSDTEVILQLYRMDGVAMLPKLRGMFAFGLWDQDQRSLLVARDPYGIKPLYYSDVKGEFRFASSVKALLAGGNIARDLEPAGLVGFEMFGSVPEPWTTFRAIKCLPAGSHARVGASGFESPQRFFSIADTYFQAEKQPVKSGDLREYFRQTLLDSVRHHLIADVPVGAFLSAGVDSGALVGLMRDAGQADIHTVTLSYDAFAGTEQDEAPLAAAVARQYGASHTIRRVDAREFREDLPKIIAAMDQPSIDGINTWFVSKATRELGLKAAISGIGGDELLGGYSTFQRLPKIVSAMRYVPQWKNSENYVGFLARVLRRLGAPVHPKVAGVMAYGQTYSGAYLLLRSVHLASELEAVVGDPDMLAQGLADLRPLELIEREMSPQPQLPFSQVAVMESSLYLRNQLLRDTDWASMAHSIEIRTPLVDSHVLTALAPYFARQCPPDGKSLLAHAPSMPLPDAVLNRKKTGFGIPIRSWYANEAGGGVAPLSQLDGDRLWSRAWMPHVRRMFESGSATAATRQDAA